MWKFLEYNFDNILKLVKEDMSESPNLQALVSFQILTGARIHEIIPNAKYRFALKFEDLMINTNEDGGIIYLPLVQKHLKMKEIEKQLNEHQKIKMKGRIMPIWSPELFEIFVNYATDMRPNWKGELLEHTILNKERYDNFFSLSMLSRGKIRLDKSRIFSRWKKTYTKHSYLFQPYREGLYIDYVIFPFTYNLVYRELSKYKLYGELIDIKTNIVKQGERPLYTHFQREATVNILMDNFNANADEITEVINWKDPKNINYYKRPNVRKILSLKKKIVNVYKEMGKENPYLTEKQITNNLETFKKYKPNKYTFKGDKFD